MLLDQRAEGHGGEELLLEDNGNPDHVRLLGLDGRLHEVLEYVAIDVDLRILHRVHDLGGHEHLVGEIGLHRRHADARRRIDQRNGVGHLAERVDRPFELVDVVEGLAADDVLGFFRLFDQLRDALTRQFAERQLQIRFPGFEVALLRQLPETVQLLRHLLEDPLQEILAEVPIVHLEVDVFLDDGMAGGTEHGGKGRQTQIGFGWIPVRREDQHHLHLPPTLGFGCPAMQLDQIETGLFTFGIFDFHEKFRLVRVSIHNE